MSQSPLHRLHACGQSPWLDFIARSLIRSGELATMIDRYGLRGVTSNPAIFQKAIDGSDAYDRAIEELARRGDSVEEIYETLAVEDVGEAADVFRLLYDGSEGGDGFVSLEVSPLLANDEEATVEEAHRLWSSLDRPNVMIKVPATEAGLPAIRRLIADGLNVNVTLLFGLERYREVAEAYLAGLEDRAARGEALDRSASVASFFLSRIDTLVDPQLERLEEQGGDVSRRAAKLRGEVAVASARRAYAVYQELFDGPRYQALVAKGARPQRLLWASTSTKNPKYSDVKYVEPLIGPDTVNTLPLDTVEAYHDHGRPEPRLSDGMEEAKGVLDGLGEVGIDLAAVTEQLVQEGVQKFIDPFEALLGAIRAKRENALR